MKCDFHNDRTHNVKLFHESNYWCANVNTHLKRFQIYKHSSGDADRSRCRTIFDLPATRLFIRNFLCVQAKYLIIFGHFIASVSREIINHKTCQTTCGNYIKITSGSHDDLDLSRSLLSDLSTLGQGHLERELRQLHWLQLNFFFHGNGQSQSLSIAPGSY